MKNKIDVLLGLQWGDEGKGKLVDFVTPNYDIVARFQGGANAGHTLIFGGEKHVLHLIPSGIFRDNCINVIGNGVVIDPISLKQEIQKIESFGVNVKSKLMISNRAHLILPTHRYLDKSTEINKGKNKIGSTLKGIGPTYMDKTGRNGIRVGDLFTDGIDTVVARLKMKHIEIITQFHQAFSVQYSQIMRDVIGENWNDILKQEEQDWWDAVNFIKEYQIVDTEYFINDALNSGKSVLAEGAQGSLLDIDFGTYPFVTSSNTTISGVVSGLGVAPTKVNRVIGIFKAYCTRVGSGPFPTELDDEVGEELRRIGHEFGATTGRPRRCGWLDLPALKYSIMINGVTELTMMKADVLSHFDEIKVCVGYMIDGKFTDKMPYSISENIIPIYTEFKGWKKEVSNIESFEDLPVELKEYISFIEKRVEVPINRLSVGPDRNQTIDLLQEDLAI